jgi:type I restriction enzyme, S subunit
VWATPKDLSELGTRHIGETARNITRRGLDSCGAKILPSGAVLLSSRAPIGLVAINTVPMATNQGFKSLVPHLDKVDASYLAHWLSANRSYLQSLGSGATFKEISKAVVSRVQIPLPSLDEQRRVARVLDAAYELCIKRCDALARLESLAEAMFVEMFGDPERNPHRWQVVRLADVATTTSGGTPSRGDDENYNGLIPWVKSGELNSGVVLDTEERITPVGLASSAAKLMPEGTVLMAMYGATVGAVTMLGIQAATNQAVCCIQVGPDIQAEYLVALLRIKKPFLLSRRSGGAQPNLSQSMIREIRLPLPPSDLQREYVMRKRTSMALTDRQYVSRTYMEALSASLQDRAFRGEL